MRSWVFLSGMMGSGKSTVASALAHRLGTEALDLDREVERAAGATVGELFAERGEAGFRQLEGEVATRLLERDGGVLALGGGTVTAVGLRRELLERGALVTLAAPIDTLVERVQGGQGRPLLASGARAALQRLSKERSSAYAECHGVVSTHEQSVPAVVEAVCQLLERAPLVVALGERSYRVEVGRGCRSRIVDPELVPRDGKVLLVTDENVASHWLSDVTERLERNGSQVLPVVLTAGEEHKRLDAIECLWDVALTGGIDRSSVVVALGGGVVGDLAGFGAATTMRGLPFVQLPTSLLAMVDASVGGKTGFDRPQGKNLVGAFYQPRGVLCDLETLRTLAPEELTNGLAEVVKAAWIDGDSAVARLESDASALRRGEADALDSAVRMAVRLKARVVAEDEREGGARRLLNLGHTLAHALEAAADYRGIRHGEAVAVGMVAAFDIARHHDVPGAVEGQRRMRSLLTALGLPTDPPRRIDQDVLRFLSTDKKRHGDAIRCVLPGMPGSIEVTTVPIARLSALWASPWDRS